MNRRNFLKMLALTPLLGIFGCKKAVSCPDIPPIMVKHPGDEYGRLITDAEFGTTHGVRWVSDPKYKILNDKTICVNMGFVPDRVKIRQRSELENKYFVEQLKNGKFNA
ncbi:hypothetical protein LCGC14_1207820 [marine sediment metagenome]|uniref:Uncharacterized protein n=1 Tax=marine sediment metagenome TaxID=412755 RepID=A0A0F9LJC9_9ZZZZ|nr:hypothetical protein [Actinomycetota bacterium]